jgi:3-mercaptopyruvate sulfurtransferase SseA
MRRILPTLLLLLVLTACGGPASAPEATATYVVMPEPTSAGAANLPRDEASVPRATLEQAYTAWAAGAAIIVDVRSQASYDTGHVAGAINIPLGEFETNIASLDLPKDAWIIPYCT